jgi:hypothetical protein
MAPAIRAYVGLAISKFLKLNSAKLLRHKAIRPERE